MSKVQAMCRLKSYSNILSAEAGVNISDLTTKGPNLLKPQIDSVACIQIACSRDQSNFKAQVSERCNILPENVQIRAFYFTSVENGASVQPVGMILRLLSNDFNGAIVLYVNFQDDRWTHSTVFIQLSRNYVYLLRFGEAHLFRGYTPSSVELLLLENIDFDIDEGHFCAQHNQVTKLQFLDETVYQFI